MPDIVPTTGFVSRDRLPQIKREDHRDFLQFLWGKGVEHTTTELPVSDLKPSQHSLDLDKVTRLLNNPSDALSKPLLVSQDHYILDGHHRWLALLNMDPHAEVPVYKMSVNFPELLKATQEYPKSFTKSVVESFESFICR